MARTRIKTATNRTTRIVLALTAAMSLCAAMAAAPSALAIKGEVSVAKPLKAYLGDDASGIRPLGRGSAIRVGRAYGADDEDCTVAVMQSADDSGHVRVRRSVSCAN